MVTLFYCNKNNLKRTGQTPKTTKYHPTQPPQPNLIKTSIQKEKHQGPTNNKTTLPRDQASRGNEQTLQIHHMTIVTPFSLGPMGIYQNLPCYEVYFRSSLFLLLSDVFLVFPPSLFEWRKQLKSDHTS